MTDTLPWIIAGACALWAIVATIIAVDNSIDLGIYKESQESMNKRTKMHLEVIKKFQERNKAERAQAVLKEIFDETYPYADGAPDASDHDKLCNQMAGLTWEWGRPLQTPPKGGET